MSDSKKINDLYIKIAALERRVNKLEHGLQELDTVVDPQGWIGEAFERLEEDIDQRFNQIEAKIDIILQHITGLSNNQDH